MLSPFQIEFNQATEQTLKLRFVVFYGPVNMAAPAWEDMNA
jgi:hypothetical protein